MSCPVTEKSELQEISSMMVLDQGKNYSDFYILGNPIVGVLPRAK